MNAFQFHLPTRILFGSDTIAQVGEAVKAAGGSRVLVLYGFSNFTTDRNLFLLAK